MPRLPLLALLAAAVLPAESIKPVEVVDIHGRFDSRSLAAHVTGNSEASGLTVVSCLGAPGCGKESVLNAIFGTQFDTAVPFPGTPAGVRPLCVASVSPENTGVLVLGSDCTGAPSTDSVMGLHGGLADVVLFHLWEADVGRGVAANTAALRALFLRHARGEKLQLVVVVHESTAVGLGPAIDAELEAVWAGLGAGAPEGRLADAVAVSHICLPHPVHEAGAFPAAMVRARDAVAGAIAGATGALPPAQCGSAAGAAWAKGSAEPVGLAPDQAEGVAVADAAWAQGRASADATLMPLLRTAERGGVAAAFGAKAQALLTETLAAFDAATVPCVVLGGAAAAQRKARRDELAGSLRATVGSIHETMLQTLGGNAVKQLEAGLLKLVKGLKEPSAPLPDEEANKVMRQVSSDFARAAAGLSVPGLTAFDQSAMAQLLSTTLNDFDESNAAKVVRMNRLQRKMERSKKQPKSPRGILPGFHLVGMLRHVGVGNLNGFAGYTMGPHSVNFGYANDRGDPETGDDSPLLRLQPKVHFDIDL